MGSAGLRWGVGAPQLGNAEWTSDPEIRCWIALEVEWKTSGVSRGKGVGTEASEASGSGGWLSGSFLSLGGFCSRETRRDKSRPENVGYW